MNSDSFSLLKNGTAVVSKNIVAQFEALDKRSSDLVTHRDFLKSVSKIIDKEENSGALIKLNINGKKVDVSHSLLARYPTKNMFIHLLTSEFLKVLPKDKEQRTFFDIDHRLILPIIDHCRDLAMWNGQEDSHPLQAPVYPNVRPAMNAFLQYFEQKNSNDIVKPRPSELFLDSVILNDLGGEALSVLNAMIIESDATFVKSLLLYCGQETTAAYQAALGKENTVIIIRDEYGNVNGGYASVAWINDSKNPHQLDRKAFLFTLAEENTAVSRKHALKLSADSSVKHVSFTAFGMRGCRSDLYIENHKLICGQLGTAYEINGCCNQEWLGGYIRNIQCIEVHQLTALPDLIPMASETSNEALIQQAATAASNSLKGPYEEIIQRLREMEHTTQEIELQEKELLEEATCLLADLRFMARYVGVLNAEQDDLSAAVAMDMSTLISSIQEVLSLLQAAPEPEPAKTVSINAGGIIVNTTKTTLRQAPEGSPLNNMASDEWGHNLDSDGNIYQDVNSDLFVCIINHLRLKVLLSGSDIEVPPITVHKAQETALNNLLSYYMLHDLPVQNVKYSGDE